MKIRWLVLVASLTSTAAFAELEGTQRVFGVAGWRYTPNDTFFTSAVANNYEPAGASIGGPQASIGFGYSFIDWAELAVDLYVGTERLSFTNAPPISSTSYGALLGVRLQTELTLFGRPFVPSLGIFTGPAFIYVSGGRLLPPTETLTDAYAGALGGTVRLTDAIGVTAEVRVLLTRGHVPTIGSINGGGAWFGLGVSWYLGQIPREQRGAFD